MLLRKALMVALVVTPFVCSPSTASAQHREERGHDRAAVASSHADEVGAGQHSHARQEMPRGIVQRFTEDWLPPGIRRTRHHEDSEPATEPDTGTTDTGTTDTGTTDTGTTDTGTTDTGTTDPGTTAPVCLAYQTVVVGFSVTQVCVLWSN
jgi:hypothetical protein